MSATNLGQCHQDIVAAMQKSVGQSKFGPLWQSIRATLLFANNVSNPMLTVTLANIVTKVAEWPEFCKEMCQKFGYDKMVGMVSVIEGADSAIKSARKWDIKVKGVKPSEALVLGVSDNYHGVS